MVQRCVRFATILIKTIDISNPKRTRKEIREAIKKIKIKRELKQ
jgi:hypothetical protein